MQSGKLLLEIVSSERQVDSEFGGDNTRLRGRALAIAGGSR